MRQRHLISFYKRSTDITTTGIRSDELALHTKAWCFVNSGKRKSDRNDDIETETADIRFKPTISTEQLRQINPNDIAEFEGLQYKIIDIDQFQHDKFRIEYMARRFDD